MGMTCQLRALSEGQIEVLLDHPHRVWDFAYNEDNVFASEDDEDDEDGEDDEDDEDDEGDDWEPLATLLAEPLAEDLWLDKSWDILRFLLVKAAGRVPNRRDHEDTPSDLFCGAAVGDEPADYVGPYLRSIEDTRAFADFLRPLTLDQLLSHFNWQEMRKAEVYLIWDEVADAKEESGLREYVGQNFQALREYVIKAADSRCGLLLWVS